MGYQLLPVATTVGTAIRATTEAVQAAFRPGLGTPFRH